MESSRPSNSPAPPTYPDDDPRISFYSANQENSPSRPQSQKHSTVLPATPFPTGVEPPSRTNSSGSSSDQVFLAPQTPDPSSSKPISQVSSPRVPAALSPPSLRESVLSPSSHLSQVVITPHEGEDEDAFHVRRTYAELEAVGVKGDGYAEGVERTRARLGSNRDSGLRALEALGDIADKKRDLTPREIEILASLDRYGFFSSPSHDRSLLLCSAPLSKRLSRVSTTTDSSPTAPPLKQQVLPQSSEKEIQRALKWARMLEPIVRDSGGNVIQWGIKASKRRKFRERVYKGIPDCWRSAAWEMMINKMSGAGWAEVERLSQEYEDYLQQPSTYDIQIDLDVPRTISGHIMFRTRYGQGQRSLFSVLHSFSLRCSECGYCQGMGSIAATLLCYLDPKRVYPALVHLHNSYGMHAIFKPGFPGLLEAIYVQERIIEQMMPGVYETFKQQMISTTSYATKWYITLFANSVPFHTQLRLWDAFFLEGPDIFIVVAVAIVWAPTDYITSKSASFETILSLLSSFFVPEDDNALLEWIEKVMSDKKARASMQQWRANWRQLVATGQDGKALL
ncbi:RabGAP/TBC [Thelephora ganbajun]|uniref:RabGAP/TBC n=1 Tax=Thelephora ganbajun TaxID=370292 RepID=A0ACB6ZXE0_THEGA|nr:RabGAP/TBC [Thelephora ganbajun]